MPDSATKTDLQFGTRRIGAVNWLGLWTLYKRETLRFLKVWSQTVAAPAVQSSLFFVIFAIVLGASNRVSADVPFAQFLAPGLIIMAMLQNAFANTSSSLIIGKVQGTIIDVLMPPLSPGELAIGYVMGGVTRAVLVGLAVGVVFFLLPFEAMNQTHVWATLYFGVSSAVLLSLIGVLTGIWAEKFDHVATITNFIVAPLTLLSGTFYSIDRLPPAMQTFSLLNPFFYVIDGFRYGFIGRADGDVATGALVLLAINTLLGYITYRVLRSGYRLKS